ncbi:hypothetical protein PDE_06442 [Penicillium oxalicum 114-2]|uniref:Uncharacterized protein n=1 Tax=Penicillium oxalicum (strain 114-2 / CGMCC 5302) TaxID=933388 RepID=S8B9M0_PENO1|nr:hypothetical protein PDE_06442 [Penicillium oxalicum 114-2]
MGCTIAAWTNLLLLPPLFFVPDSARGTKRAALKTKFVESGKSAHGQERAQSTRRGQKCIEDGKPSGPAESSDLGGNGYLLPQYPTDILSITTCNDCESVYRQESVVQMNGRDAPAESTSDLLEIPRPSFMGIYRRIDSAINHRPAILWFRSV